MADDWLEFKPPTPTRDSDDEDEWDLQPIHAEPNYGSAQLREDELLAEYWDDVKDGMAIACASLAEAANICECGPSELAHGANGLVQQADKVRRIHSGKEME